MKDEAWVGARIIVLINDIMFIDSRQPSHRTSIKAAPSPVQRRHYRCRSAAAMTKLHHHVTFCGFGRLLRRPLTPVSNSLTLRRTQVDTGVKSSAIQSFPACAGSAMKAAMDHSDLQEYVAAQPFLAADVGGTHSRVALMRASRCGNGALDVLSYRIVDCK